MNCRALYLLSYFLVNIISNYVIIYIFRKYFITHLIFSKKYVDINGGDFNIKYNFWVNFYIKKCENHYIKFSNQAFEEFGIPLHA